MEYIVLCRATLERAVPIINLAIGLRDIGVNVMIVCSISQNSTKEYLAEHGIIVKDVDTDYRESKSFLLRFRNWIIFRIRIRRFLKSVDPKQTVLYVGTADTAMSVGKTLLKYEYILHIRELYDEFPRYLKALNAYANHAKKVIVPEYNRGAIFRSWFQLKESPIVLPNKPIKHPRQRGLTIDDKEVENILRKKCRGRKLILYQGNITPDRDLSVMAAAMQDLSNEYILMLLGTSRNGTLESIIDINSSIIHIPFIPPPGHLQITSHAHIGLVTYTYKSLNNVFCAPNKIWEYSGFGIPMLANDVPGLKYCVESNDVGVCVDYSNVEAIKNGIKRIEENYKRMEKNAVAFFDDQDMKTIMCEIIR